MARRSRPLIIALAVSPPVASAVSAACAFVLGSVVANPDDELGVGAATAVFFAASLFFGYLAAAVPGVPGYILFRRFGWVRRRHWFLLGTLIGCASAGLLLAMALLSSDDAGSEAVYAIVGVAVLSALPTLAMGLVFMWMMRGVGQDIDRIAATFD